MINQLAKQVYEANKLKGFWDENDLIPMKMQAAVEFSPEDVKAIERTFRAQKLMLTASELAEALEADRKDRFARDLTAERAITITDDELFKAYFKANIKDTYQDELADAFIRILDQAGGYGIDLDSHVKAKLRFNALRPYKHGKNS